MSLIQFHPTAPVPMKISIRGLVITAKTMKVPQAYPQVIRHAPGLSVYGKMEVDDAVIRQPVKGRAKHNQATIEKWVRQTGRVKPRILWIRYSGRDIKIGVYVKSYSIEKNISDKYPIEEISFASLYIMNDK